MRLAVGIVGAWWAVTAFAYLNGASPTVMGAFLGSGIGFLILLASFGVLAWRAGR